MAIRSVPSVRLEGSDVSHEVDEVVVKHENPVCDTEAIARLRNGWLLQAGGRHGQYGVFLRPTRGFGYRESSFRVTSPTIRKMIAAGQLERRTGGFQLTQVK
jgi:hypothetical protein